MTAMRLPSVSTESSQRAVCTTGPANSSRPGMSGTAGWCSTPVAQTTTSAADLFAVGGGQRPAAGLLVPLRCHDFSVQPNMFVRPS